VELGEALGVGVGVELGVDVGVGVGLEVGVGVGVGVGLDVGVRVAVAVVALVWLVVLTITSGSRVILSVGLGVGVGVEVGLGVGVALGVELGEALGVALGVELGVDVGVGVGLEVGVGVGVGLGVGVGVALADAAVAFVWFVWLNAKDPSSYATNSPLFGELIRKQSTEGVMMIHGPTVPPSFTTGTPARNHTTRVKGIANLTSKLTGAAGPVIGVSRLSQRSTEIAVNGTRCANGNVGVDLPMTLKSVGSNTTILILSVPAPA
jgi:hypothetical protein